MIIITDHPEFYTCEIRTTQTSTTTRFILNNLADMPNSVESNQKEQFDQDLH